MAVTENKLSDVPILDDDTGAASNGSLRDRLAARRRELQQERQFVLPVDGFEDLGLCARYRVLPFENIHRIALKHKLETSDGTLAAGADELIQACLELVEKQDDDTYKPLGFKWGTDAARELFGIDDLPEQALARTAVFRIFDVGGPNGSMNLISHVRRYDEELGKIVPAIEEQMGELSASSAQR